MAVTDPDARPTSGCRCSSCRTDTPGIEIVRNVGIGVEPTTRARTRTSARTMSEFPRDHILGGVGQGFVVAQTRLGGGRIHHAMRTVGLVQRPST